MSNAQARDAQTAADESERAGSAVVGAPRLSRLTVIREAALRKLDVAVSDPLCVVHAPAGYGKTTLLAQWARRRSGRNDSARVLWLTVDQSCSGRFAFWSRVQDLVGGVETTAPLDGDVAEPGGDISASLPQLIEHIFARLRNPTVLVVDAWENAADPAIRDDVLRLVRHNPPLSIVIGTRTLDPELLTAGAPHGVSILTAEDLRFSAVEFAALAEQAAVPLDPGEIAGFIRASEGWPFALRVLLDAAEDHLHFELEGSATLEILRAQLVNQVSRFRGYDYLLLTSVSESFTPELAEWLGADAEDAAVLDAVESHGLGAWEGAPLAGFRLQPLLREGLQGRLDPATSRRLHRRLALWYERSGQLPRAFFSALDAHDATLAVGYAQRAFVPITMALNRAPESLTSQRRAFFAGEPLLSLLNAIAHNVAGHTGRATRGFLTTIALSEAQLIGRHGHPDPSQVWVQAALAAGLRLTGRYELVERAYRRFRRMLEHAHDPEGVLNSAETLFACESAVTLIYLDRLEDVLPLLEEVRLPAAGQRRRQHFYPACLLTYAEAASGRVSAAAHRSEELQDRLPRLFDHSFYAVPLHLAAALVLLEDFRAEDAAAKVELCMPHWKTIEMWPLVLETEIRALWQTHGPELALQRLDVRIREKQRRPPISPAMSALLDALRAELLVAVGEFSRAHDLAPVRRYRAHPRLAVSRALTFLFAGQPDRALTVFEQVKDSDRLLRRHRIDLELVSAAALLHMGDVELAASRFDTAAHQALDAGLRLSFALLPSEDARTLARGTAREVEVTAIVDALPIRYHDAGEAALLTKRERVVLGQLASTATLTQIATQLNVSINTVKSQVRSVYRKLGAKDRADAVTEAQRRGIL